MLGRKPKGYLPNLAGEGEEEVTTDFRILHSRLETEHKRLTEELAQLKAGVRPIDERREGSPFGKREEEATETFELEKRLALENRIMGELAKIEHALKKFDEGTYGKCDSCGQPIDPARLEALPQAHSCVSCKAKKAKNAKGTIPHG